MSPQVLSSRSLTQRPTNSDGCVIGAFAAFVDGAGEHAATTNRSIDVTASRRLTLRGILGTHFHLIRLTNTVVLQGPTSTQPNDFGNPVSTSAALGGRSPIARSIDEAHDRAQQRQCPSWCAFSSQGHHCAIHLAVS